MLNIHPVIVHTPIGLLTLYSIIELLRFKKLQERPYIFYTKAILVIVGFGGAVAAYLSGDMIEELFTSANDLALIEVHSTFALITSVLYGVIAASYVVLWFQKECGTWGFLKNKNIAGIWKMKLAIANFIQKPWIIGVLALLALVAIFITGALGGAIVYGPEADPAVSVIYHLFFK